jgi:hypothetical protein
MDKYVCLKDLTRRSAMQYVPDDQGIDAGYQLGKKMGQALAVIKSETRL